MKKILACIFTIIIIAGGGYFIYLNASYYRLDDDLPLYVINDVTKKIDHADELTITSANIGYGAFDKDFSFFMDGGTSATVSYDEAKFNIDNLITPIKDLDPDFSFFQEVDYDSTRTQKLNENYYINMIYDTYSNVYAQNYDSPFIAWPLNDMFGKVTAGLSTYSKYQVESATRYSLPISDSLTKFLDLDRCYIVTRIPVDNGKELVLINCHTSAYGADEEIIKEQTQKILNTMQEEYDKGNYVIAGGDFNQDMIGDSDHIFNNDAKTWAKPFDFSLVPDNIKVVSKEYYDNGILVEPTCRNANKPYDGSNEVWIIDTFLVTNNIKVNDYSTLNLNFEYSDHNPIIMKFKLKP